MADKAFTDLPAGTPATTDLIAYVEDPTGTAVSKKATLSDIMGGVRWAVNTGTSSTLVAGEGVVANNAALHTGTLPATAAVNDRFGLATMQGQVRLGQATGQTIHFGNEDTTTGTGGYFESYTSENYSLIEVICIVANTDFMVVNSQNNWAAT